MAEWQEDNLSSILEYPFDFDRYIAEQLRQIDDLDERKFAKSVLVEGFGKMIHQTEAKYKELEHRIYQEIAIPDNKYEITTTVVDQEYYDPTNPTLFPMIPLDLKEDACREAYSTEDFLYVGTLFLHGGMEACRRLAHMGSCRGTMPSLGEQAAGKNVPTGRESQKEMEFHIRKADRYQQAVEQLYQMFMDNHIPWETVNTGYLDKFFDVFLPLDGKQKEGGKQLKLPKFKEVELQLGVLGDMAGKGVIPLWNIEPITFACKNFMVPCIDGIYYEHEFRMEDEKRKDGYLIQTREEILEIRHENGKIILKTYRDTFEGWQAIRMVQDKTVRSLDYNEPFLSNHKTDSFIRRYANQSKVSLLTKTELFRKIMELEIGAYIEIEGYEILDNGKAYPFQESMNFFIRDELFPMEGRKVLLLKFKEMNPGYYLNDCMMWFVISKLQLEIGEYRCVGIFE